MSTVHFVVNYGLYVKPGVQLTKWLVTSVDSDQWMSVLLAMGTGRIPTCGQSCMDVTVIRHVRSTTEYVHVNRVYHAIINLSDEASYAGWPAEAPS